MRYADEDGGHTNTRRRGHQSCRHQATRVVPRAEGNPKVCCRRGVDPGRATHGFPASLA